MSKQVIKTEKMEVDAEILEDIKPKIEIVEEPLLGSVSVTTISKIEGPEVKSQQLRSSARVFKKMKLDIPTVTAPPPVEENEKKEEIKQEVKRCYRPLWTSDDKTIFFEALNEFGKDFENIQLYISMKLKKKGVPENMIKTRDQVRHLYYRSWHKVSKYVKFSECIKKLTQELYSLINYGELRKKLGSVNEKCLQKLNELIYMGSTVIRMKGKTVRIKTPVCRALRKLNQLDEKYDEIRLPNRILVELRPKDMTSFLKVQSMAQNPRIRVTVPLQKRLNNLISCVNKRWQTVEAKAYEKSIISTSSITENCIPPSSVSEKNRLLLTPTLRLTPPVDAKINILSINLSEYLTKQSICLHSYEHRRGIINTAFTMNNHNNYKVANRNTPKKGCRARIDSNSEKFLQKCALSTEENEPGDSTENEQSVEVNKIVNQANAAQFDNIDTDDEHVKIKIEKKEEPEHVNIKVEKNEEPIVNDEANDQNQAKINKIRQGWTELDSETVTIGELYLMFGADLKLTLDYSWDKLEKSKPKQTQVDNLELNDDISNDCTSKLDLSDSLSKLLSVAKLHYRKNVIKCPCGHVCGPKNNAQLKKAVEKKIRKILTDIEKSTDETDDKGVQEENMFDNEQPFVRTPVYIQPKITPTTYRSQPNAQTMHLINSIQRMNPKYCNRKGRRPRSKQVVVERKLPLLPNRMDSGHQIVRMNIISQETTEPKNLDIKNVKIENENVFINPDPSSVFPQESHCATDIICKSVGENEVVLKLANDNVLISAPPSPSTILREDNQWINSEVADYSLSSLLGHFESPIKANSSLANDDSRLSQDVDAQISSLLTESSLDFAANFADLAAQVTNETRK